MAPATPWREAAFSTTSCGVHWTLSAWPKTSPRLVIGSSAAAVVELATGRGVAVGRKVTGALATGAGTGTEAGGMGRAGTGIPGGVGVWIRGGAGGGAGTEAAGSAIRIGAGATGGAAGASTGGPLNAIGAAGSSGLGGGGTYFSSATGTGG